MSQLNTARFTKLRALGYTGATNDMLRAWLKANGATSNQLTDCWYQALGALGFTTGARNDRWFAYLRSLGYTGAANDMELQFWSNLVANGGFTNATGWTLGAGWSIAAGKLTATAASTTASTPVTGMVTGNSYRIIYTVSGLTAGTVRFEIVGATTQQGTIRASNFTWSETIVATPTAITTFRFLGAAASLSIDNVSIIAV